MSIIWPISRGFASPCAQKQDEKTKCLTGGMHARCIDGCVLLLTVRGVVLHSKHTHKTKHTHKSPWAQLYCALGKGVR